jgi:hypothetical protein
MNKLIERLCIGFVAVGIAVGLYFNIANGAPDATIRTNPTNSQLIWEDSVRIKGTETKIMKAMWQDGYAQKAVLIEARDDSTAGWKSDSGAVRLSVLQVFPFTSVTGRQYFAALNSRANPDSTTKLGSSVFNLFDSLDIKAMDTSGVYLRSYYNSSTYGGTGVVPGDSLKTKQTVTAGFGAMTYIAQPYDFSPAVAFKLTGLASNLSRGVGSMWKIRVYGLKGNKVTQGN